MSWPTTADGRAEPPRRRPQDRREPSHGPGGVLEVAAARDRHRRRAVGRRLHGAARTAGVRPPADPRSAATADGRSADWRRPARRRRRTAACGRSGRWRRSSRRSARGSPSARDDVGRVLAEVVELGCESLNCLDHPRERRCGDVGQRRASPCSSVIRSPLPVGLRISALRLADGRNRCRGQLAAAAGRTGRAGATAGFDSTTSGVQRVERLAQAGERRGRVVQRRWQQLTAPARAPGSGWRSPRSSCSCSRPAGSARRLREPSACIALAPWTSSPSNAGSLRVELAGHLGWCSQAPGRGTGASVGLRRLALDARGLALDEVAQTGSGLRGRACRTAGRG